jgi:hypothetical protein
MNLIIPNIKKFAILVLIIGFQQLLTSSKPIKLSGAHEASTGAPNEQTCAKSGCHSDAIVGPGDLVNKLIFNNGDSVYTPGVTYPVTIRATKTGIKRFGFQVTVLKSSDNAYAGTLVVTNSTLTQLQSGIAPNPTRKYITHQSAGATPVSAGVGEWTFSWKAPATNVGAIKFYYATNATNMNNQNTGDQIFLSSFEIKPKGTIGISEAETKEFFNAYYSAASGQLLISYNHLPIGDAKIEIRDMQGRLVQSSRLNNTEAHVKNQQLNLNESIANGIYLVTYRLDNTMLSRKIYIGK